MFTRSHAIRLYEIETTTAAGSARTASHFLAAFLRPPIRGRFNLEGLYATPPDVPSRWLDGHK
jgi:hypothetical protein